MTELETVDTLYAQASALVAASAGAAAAWARTSRTARARALRAVADQLDAAADELVRIAQAETRLPEGRLRGELARTTFQLRLFTEVLSDGGFLGARIDHADPDWPMGARPDLRRELTPLGPVVVFAASNFPFAFSVAGGDTASALAAGCPVIVKAHPGHLRLSSVTAAVVTDALASVGAPAGVFGIVFGLDAGRTVLQHPAIKAGAFTGSLAGGRALFDLAAARPDPIPFFGELGSVNPVFVTEAAAVRRPGSIASELIGSFTLGAGQFCTKPGLVFVPEGSALVEELTGATLPAPAPMLNAHLAEGYRETLAELVAAAGVRTVAGGVPEPGSDPAPTVLVCSTASLLADWAGLFRECFGPSVLVVTYGRESELLEVAAAIDGQLTATLVAEPHDEIAPALVERLATKAGRLLWNQWPTGVSVTYAQQHGGPFPATTAAGTTSVGTAAVERFLRPVAYQGFPEHLLPTALRDGSTDVPRLVDGRRAG